MSAAGFAFRGDISGVDAPLRSRLQAYLRGREREINSVQRISLRCNGGPFDGRSIELEAGQAASATFTVGSWAGRYEIRGNQRSGQWAEWRSA